MNFNKFRNSRLAFLEAHKNKDHVVILGNTSVLLSAPHGVSQVRLGKQKVAEIGTIPFSLELQKRTSAHLIAKTKNSFDDANFDETSKFKRRYRKNISEEDIANAIDSNSRIIEKQLKNWFIQARYNNQKSRGCNYGLSRR